MRFRIERVDGAATFPLRRRVLRPHETHDELTALGADRSAPCHFAAVDDGVVIGSAAVALESPPWASDRQPAWRLRGMATAEDRRHEGVGAALLETAIEHVRQSGGGLLWCNARTPAVPFYERAGFETRSERWVDPNIGPHIAMELHIDEF